VSASADLITLVVTIAGLGVAAQVLADRLEVPSVLFLVLAGIAVGPEGLGVLEPDAFGEALPAIVGLSVAVIVFEGAFHLHVERLREAPRETLRLVTVGALGSFLGTAVVVRYVLDAPWDVSLLVGALLVATGPTVITPIVNVVAVSERVASTLETEGVVNDVTAAILGVVMFEYVVLEETTLAALLGQFTFRLGIGVGGGAAVAAVVWYILGHTDLSADNAPQNARLVVLVAALVAYGGAEAIAPESGIAAVATAGLLLGNASIPYRAEIEQFKGDVTLLVLSFVFITLASLLSLSDLLALGVGGLVVVVLVAGVLRPALVALCTVGDRFTLRERAFVAAIGPRGIIPASVATLFALELRPDNEAAATVLVGTVFLVILATVLLQGGFARHIAQLLDVIPMRVIIVGGGRVGRALGERLEDRGEDVALVETDTTVVETARSHGFSVRQGDGTDQDVLRRAGADNAKVVAAATSDDDVNLLIAQLARNTFGVDTVVARVNDPTNEEAFEDLDVDAIPAGMSVAWAMDNVIERPAIATWMTELDRAGDVQEIEITAGGVSGRPVGEVEADLPEGCHIALVSRDGTNSIPDPEMTLREGDHLTVIGRKEAVHEAIERIHPGP
jgi:NhaP-type Na+/H+ or K+/H+ antiporter